MEARGADIGQDSRVEAATSILDFGNDAEFADTFDPRSWLNDDEHIMKGVPYHFDACTFGEIFER